MRVYFYDENGDSLGEGTDDEFVVIGGRVTLENKVFTVIWTGGLKWDAGKNILFKPVLLQPDSN